MPATANQAAKGVPQVQLHVAAYAPDPITFAGLAHRLAARPDVVLVTPGDRAEADVVVAAVDRLSAGAVQRPRALAVELDRQAVLLVDDVAAGDPAIATENWVSTVLPRTAAADDRVVTALRAAAGRVVPAPGEEGLTTVSATRTSLSAREIDVLRLMADGLNTADIAEKLRYSERTVKNVLYRLTSRVGLHNRAHAVAYGIRAGYF